LERLALPAELLGRGHRPALLHSVDHVAPAWGPWRSVVTVHDLAFLRLPETHTAESRRYYAQTAASVQRAARVIAVSHATARDLVELLGADPARVRVVHNAAAEVFYPRSEGALQALAAQLGTPLPRPYLLFVGTIEPRKNLPLLLEALALLVQHLDVHLVVAGRPGWLEQDSLAAVGRLGLDGRVTFVGSLAEEPLAVLYSHAAVLAYPSLYEGFGLPLVEAMACGAPVVSSDAGPMPEVVGDAAVLLPPTDPRAWADALGRVLSDPATAAELRLRGIARAAEFSWARAARETRAVYAEALA
jgi:glycosyltransferase involved in cell wall biosynthesis